MKTVRWIDGREGILERLDEVRERVAKGEIVSFAVAYATRDGGMGGRWWTLDNQPLLFRAALRGAVGMVGYQMDALSDNE